MTTAAVLESTFRTIREFRTSSEAEEWLANNASEDGTLTETEWAGDRVLLVPRDSD